MTALSILDLVRITQATDARGALDNARDLAAHAERWGYQRFWVAEHHNMAGVASAATAVVVGHIAGGTKTIRVGAGGIMLPNHAPMIIAEQFGTLARLFPGRIDLGLGRAPGTDQLTVRALRRSLDNSDNFPQDVMELQAFFAAGAAGPEDSGSTRRRHRCAAVDTWALAHMARSSPPSWDCPTRSRRISRRINCCTRSISTATTSSHPNNSRSRMRWWG